jgi:CRP-like cAMP-binding protein
MAIEDDIALLARVPTLNLLGRDALRILAIGAETRYLSAGDTLFNVGDASDCGYVVQDGALRLTSSVTEGAHEITLGPSALIGEVALLAETKRPATAIAMEPTTVLRISRSLFLKTLEGFPEAARRLRGVMSARAEEAARDIDQIRTALDARGEID